MVRKAFCFATLQFFTKQDDNENDRRMWGVGVWLIVTLFKVLFPRRYNRRCPTTLLNLAWSRIYSGSVTQHHDFFLTFWLYLVHSRRQYGIKVRYYGVLGGVYSEGYSSILDTVVKVYLIWRINLFMDTKMKPPVTEEVVYTIGMFRVSMHLKIF